MSVHMRNLQLLLTAIYNTINNLNPTFMAEIFAAKDVSYNLCGSINLAYLKPGQTCMAWILTGLLVINYGRFCQKKSKCPKHWQFLKEILSP